jgi:hypothetical protein
MKFRIHEDFSGGNTKPSLRMLQRAWRVGLTGIMEIKEEYWCGNHLEKAIWKSGK